MFRDRLTHIRWCLALVCLAVFAETFKVRTLRICVFLSYRLTVLHLSTSICCSRSQISFRWMTTSSQLVSQPLSDCYRLGRTYLIRFGVDRGTSVTLEESTTGSGRILG
jgi:hypothetical protein